MDDLFYMDDAYMLCLCKLMHVNYVIYNLKSKSFKNKI